MIFDKYINDFNLMNVFLDNYQDINIKIQDTNIYRFVVFNNLCLNVFIDTFCNFNVQYGINDISSNIISSILYNKFLTTSDMFYSNKYIFHNALETPEMSTLLQKLIPLPNSIENINDLRIARLYTGCKHSGTHLHEHSPALNYLISGHKLWIIIPNTIKNIKFLLKNEFTYHFFSKQSDKSKSVLKWVVDNYNFLINNINDISVFYQYSGQVVYIPNSFYHAVVNLEDSYGITYSWI